MDGRGGTARVLRPDDPLGHLVPPGQLLPTDVARAVLDAIDAHRFRSGIGVPSVPSRFVVRMHPADRAWLPAGFETTLGEQATAHADRAGLLVLDGLQVSFETDLACDPGSIAVRAGYGEGDLVVLRDPTAALSVFDGR